MCFIHLCILRCQILPPQPETTDEPRGGRSAIRQLWLRPQHESVRSSDAGGDGPHSALTAAAPSLSTRQESPPGTQPRREARAPRRVRQSSLRGPTSPHLVSKYTLGGCQESGGIAAITEPAESLSSKYYFRRRFARDPSLQRTLPVPSVPPLLCQDLGN